MTMLFGTAVLADGVDTSTFDFSDTQLTISQGDQASISIRAKYDYDVYIVGNRSKYTYVKTDNQSGDGTVTFVIGPDETSNSIQFWFYARNHGDIFDHVQVDVNVATKPVLSIGVSPNVSEGLQSAPISLPDGTVGYATLVSGNLLCFVVDAAGNPLATFSVLDTNGKLLPMELGATIPAANGINYLHVDTDEGTKVIDVAITAVDRQKLMIRGIAGLYLNHKFVAWK
jgi:hypothetical protein